MTSFSVTIKVHVTFFMVEYVIQGDLSWVLVAHNCNPSYSGSRDQEDRGLKPPQANSSRDPISKIPDTKKGLVEWLKV
jgi:hypothetical protein